MRNVTGRRGSRPSRLAGTEVSTGAVAIAAVHVPGATRRSRWRPQGLDEHGRRPRLRLVPMATSAWHTGAFRRSERAELARVTQHQVGSPPLDQLGHPRKRRAGAEAAEDVPDDGAVGLLHRQGGQAPEDRPDHLRRNVVERRVPEARAVPAKDSGAATRTS